MPYTPSQVAKELGKAQEIKMRKVRWPAESKNASRIQERLKLLAREKHKLILKRNTLSLQNAILEARLLRLSKKKQEARVRNALTQYFENSIAENKRIGLPIAGLEKARKNVGKVAGGIMTKGKAYRDLQKPDLYLGSASVAVGAILGASKPPTLGDVFVGMGAAGGIIAADNLHRMRKGIKKKISENKSRREELTKEALSK